MMTKHFEYRIGSPDGAPLPLSGHRIRLLNVKFSPNLGDGLLSEALEGALRELGGDPEQTFSVDLAARTEYGPGSVARARLLKTLNVMPPSLRKMASRLPLELKLRRHWKPHYEANLAGAQAVVIGGGNLFSDMDLNFPTKISAVLRLAARHRLPTAIYGVGVSGGWSAAGLAMVRAALSVARPCYVSVRDNASKERFDAMFAEAAGRSADVVRDPGLLISRYVKACERQAGLRPIGLCVTSAISVNYHSEMSIDDQALADWYVALGRRVGHGGRTVLAFTNGSPEDEQFLDSIAVRLEQALPGRILRQTVATPAALARLIAGLDVLVAHRMHALIAAYSFGVPIYALKWDLKIEAFMASVGAESFISAAIPGTEAVVAEAVNDFLEGANQNEQRRAEVLAQAYADVADLSRELAAAISFKSAA